jgi:hypothetical protein
VSVIVAFDPEAALSIDWLRRTDSGKGSRGCPRLRPRNVRRKLWYLSEQENTFSSLE